jgi:hypothetical protein
MHIWPFKKRIHFNYECEFKIVNSVYHIQVWFKNAFLALMGPKKQKTLIYGIIRTN